jgi:hypothetical protein
MLEKETEFSTPGKGLYRIIWNIEVILWFKYDEVRFFAKGREGKLEKAIEAPPHKGYQPAPKKGVEKSSS